MKVEVRQTMTPDWDKVGIEKPKSIFIASLIDQEKAFIAYHPGKLEYEKSMHNFVSGSTYEGNWNALGFSGYGTYFFAHGASYQGYFKDGQFHGKGIITYPVGHKLKGYWKNGKMIYHIFVFYDHLEATVPFDYCQMPDRRFQIEFNTSLKGPGEECLTNRQPTVNIPAGCYDTIDGFCDPTVNCIFNYDEGVLAGTSEGSHKRETDNLKRTIQKDECKFIKDNYRVSSLKTVGFRPDLYEYWVTGRGREIREILTELGYENLRSSNPSGTLLTQESQSDYAFMEVELL